MAQPQLLKDVAYYRTGTTCLAYEEPETTQDLADLRAKLWHSKTPYYLLGGGTNSVLSDHHFPGVVIGFSRLNRLDFSNPESIYVEAGVDNSHFSRCAQQRNLEGAAWMYRLPGQIGGTTRMNARCYGGEISQIVRTIRVVTEQGEIKDYQANSQVFCGYKDTIFMRNHDAIVAVSIRLTPGDGASLLKEMESNEADRVSKNQFILPSCGCAFKNSYEAGVPSGMLLQAANVYELQHPRIVINPKHANFVFNNGAHSDEIIQFTLAMREKVYQEFGVWLEYEMEVLGQIPPNLAAQMHETREQRFKMDKLQPLRERFQGKRSP